MRQFSQVSGLRCFWTLLIVPCVCVMDSLGASVHRDMVHFPSHKGDVLLFKRQEATATDPSETTSSTGAGEFFASYWFIFVVVALFVVIVAVFVGACVVRVRKRSHQSGSLELSRRSPESSRTLRPQRSMDEHSLPQHTTGSSSVAGGSPISLSVGPTPIPSPQPSAASSQRSYRSQSGKRRRNHSSGHVSSSSDETIRAHDFHSTTSLMSHASSQGGVHPRVSRTESVSSGDRHRHSGRHSRHRRTTSNPHIKVLPSDGHTLYSAPSSTMQSMESVHSQRSSHSSSQKTLVDVDVTVHLGAENDHEVRKEIAAALAESARKLAQSAANFDQEDSHTRPHRSHSQLSRRGSLQSRRQLFPNHSSSISLGHEGRSYSPVGPPIVSLDRRGLERPHHTFPNRAELVRRNSLTRAPPPESPLRISHSRHSSQRSLSSGSYSPTAKVPMHMQVHHIRSLDDHRGRHEVSLDNINSSPSPPHPALFTPKAILDDRPPYPVIQQAPPPHQVSAILDFTSLEHSSPLSSSPEGARGTLNGKGSKSYVYVRNDSMVESDHGISPDSGMGNGDYATGTESSSSTLRSSHVEKRDRLSRLSEKSIEYLNCEDAEGTNRGPHTDKRAQRNVEEEGHRRKISQPVRGEVVNGYAADGEKMASGHVSHSADAHKHASIRSNSSSGSQASLDENSTAGSGYAATGSASSVESTSREQSRDSHMIDEDLESRFSYPLEKLLSQPLTYDLDCDNIGNSPLTVSMETSRHGHHRNPVAMEMTNHGHRGYTYSNGHHPPIRTGYGARTPNRYSLDAHRRTRSESKLMPTHTRGGAHLPYHSVGAKGARHQSSSITVDV